MNREDIIEMARGAGCTANEANAWGGYLERFAALVAAAEREACAKVADRYHVPMCDTAADAIAAAIRARGAGA